MDELIQTFLEETDDNLRLLEEGLFALKDDPDDEELINEVFRAMHTIKGGAGLMGFDRINRVAHHLEDILDRVRQGKVAFNEDMFHLLIASADLFRSIIESGDLDAGSFQQRCEEMIVNSEKVLNGGKKKRKARANAKVEEVIETAEESFNDNPWSNQAAFPYVHIEMKFQPTLFENGTDPLMLIMELEGLGQVKRIVMDQSQLPTLEELDPEQIYVSWQIWLESASSESDFDTVFLFVKDENQIVYNRTATYDSVESAFAPAPKITVGDSVVELHVPMKQTAVTNTNSTVELWLEDDWTSSPSQDVPKIPIKEPKDSKENDGNSENKKMLTSSETIRVDTAKLEQMLNYVAEVVISQSRVKELVYRLTGERRQNTELSNAFQEVDKIIRYLQEEVMKTTMIPIAGLFSRYQRMIRDLEKETGKRVEVYLEGKETEVDKNVIEQMTDPLKHIIRNAIDHGMDTPEERHAAGKDPVGKITLRAYHQEGFIIIEISEDGRGINQKAVINKAVEKGLIQPSQKLSEQEVYRLLFRPGFSTAKQITDLSGRGVGLDVVLTNIQKMRGEVEVFSELGKGTTFQIKLPLTLAIIDGMMIQVAEDRFILPLTNVVELMRPVPSMIKSIENQGTIVQIRDEFIPYIRMSDVFGIYSKNRNKSDGILIILREGVKKMALHVDHIIGQEQVVIRSIKENAGSIDGVAGATIMGDGQVVTIIDVSYVFRTSKFHMNSFMM